MVVTEGDEPAIQRLTQLDSVTASALAPIKLEEFLAELLEHAREMLAADTAAVLLLDAAGRELVATAAAGIEEEVRQGVRIPLGVGFAGRVAAEAAPVILDHVDRGNVANRILLDKGIQSLLGVPLIASGKVLGVLHVGTVRPHTFTPRDVELLQRVAERIALATQVRRTETERGAVIALQQSLLPARPAKIPGFVVAARYVPGGGGAIGGDWYDVFALPGGRTGFVIGDVVGRGVHAAIVMGRLRSALRAYALDGGGPAEVLRRLDRKVQHFEPGEMATVLFAVVDDSRTHVEISSAGHLPPILKAPGGVAQFAVVRNDTPIGSGLPAIRQSVTVDLPPGAVLCLYTDGLVERRGEHIDASLERLRAAIPDFDDVEDVSAEIMSALVGDAVSPDDIALVVVKREVGGGELDLVVPAVPASLSVLRSTLRVWLSDVGASPDDTQDVLLSVGEACMNAVEHAYGTAGGLVRLRVALEDRTVVATVSDRGQWRPPRGVGRGRGIRMMNEVADSVEIDRASTGTTVTVRRTLGGTGGRD